MSLGSFQLLFALLAGSLAGCDEPAPVTVKTTSAPASRAVAAPGNGSLRGRVTLNGWNGIVKTYPDCRCGNTVRAIKEEKVVVAADGSLKNVVISIKDAPTIAHSSPLPALLLYQKECVYVPHVMALQIGQTLRVTNSDDTLHNIHTINEFGMPMNWGQRLGDERKLTFKESETFRVKCDVHPWMTAWIAVFDHPYFAVTDAGGSFKIHNIPAGKYAIIAWHEFFPAIEQQVVIDELKPTELKLVFSPPNEK